MLEKTLESPLDCKGIQPVHPKGDQCWVFIGRTDAEAEIPILWPPDARDWLIWKDRDAGKDWGQEEEGTTEEEMVGRHHRLLDKSVSQLRRLVMDRKAWRAAVHGVAGSDTTETELNWGCLGPCALLLATVLAGVTVMLGNRSGDATPWWYKSNSGSHNSNNNTSAQERWSKRVKHLRKATVRKDWKPLAGWEGIKMLGSGWGIIK